MSVKKVIFLLFTLSIAFGVFFVFFTISKSKGSDPERSPAPTAPTPEEAVQKTEETSIPTVAEPPKALLLKVPFTSQAPTANWDQLHEEACEEASVLMANAYFQGDTRSILPAEEAEKEIKSLTKWQQETLGYYLSINSEETVRMIHSVYGLKAEILHDFSENTIKTALAEGKLILVPANGRKLRNPHFTPPGPIYHMFLIKGYDEKSFIVNDPGTKHGQDYRYSYQTIKGALGDYNHTQKATDPSQSVLIIVSK